MMASYEVRLKYSGWQTFYIESPDEDEAIGLAYDELDSLHQLDNLEVIDSESCKDNDPEGEW
jgi:hypothetical protein